MLSKGVIRPDAAPAGPFPLALLLSVPLLLPILTLLVLATASGRPFVFGLLLPAALREVEAEGSAEDVDAFGAMEGHVLAVRYRTREMQRTPDVRKGNGARLRTGQRLAATEILQRIVTLSKLDSALWRSLI